MTQEQKEKIEGFVCMIGDGYTCQWKVMDNDEIITQILDRKNEVQLEVTGAYTEMDALIAKESIIQKWKQMKKNDNKKN